MLQKWHGSGSWYIQKEGGQAERMINPGYQKESVAMQELKIDARLLDEVLYYGVAVWRRMDLHGPGEEHLLSRTLPWSGVCQEHQGDSEDSWVPSDWLLATDRLKALSPEPMLLEVEWVRDRASRVMLADGTVRERRATRGKSCG